MLKYIVIVVPTLFVLAGCETPEERVTRLLPAAQERCEAFGFQEGSNSYAQCLQREVSRLEDQEEAALQAFADAMDAATPQQTTCYTTGYGYGSTTTCY